MAGSSSEASRIPDSEKAMDLLQANGSLDRLRMQAIEALEHDAGLRQSIKQAVTESRALEHFSQADKRSTKTLQTQLNSELAANLSRDALRTLWHVLSDPQSDVSQQIDSAAREALCRMHAEHLQSQAQQTSGSAKLEGPA